MALGDADHALISPLARLTILLLLALLHTGVAGIKFVVIMASVAGKFITVYALETGWLHALLALAGVHIGGVRGLALLALKHGEGEVSEARPHVSIVQVRVQEYVAHRVDHLVIGVQRTGQEVAVPIQINIALGNIDQKEVLLDNSPPAMRHGATRHAYLLVLECGRRALKDALAVGEEVVGQAVCADCG